MELKGKECRRSSVAEHLEFQRSNPRFMICVSRVTLELDKDGISTTLYTMSLFYSDKLDPSSRRTSIFLLDTSVRFRSKSRIQELGVSKLNALYH